MIFLFAIGVRVKNDNSTQATTSYTHARPKLDEAASSFKKNSLHKIEFNAL